MPRKTNRFGPPTSGPVPGNISPNSKNSGSSRPSFPSLPPRLTSAMKYVGFALSILLASAGGYTYHLIKQAEKTTPTGREIYEGLRESAAISTHIRDFSGQIIATVGGKNEDDVSIDDMNPYLVASLIAVEDKRFWHHNGFDTEAIWGMIRDNVVGQLNGTGGTRGGSTIGSQLFKKDVPKRSGKFGYYMARGNQKILEWVQAGKLFEQGVDAKWFALEWYLNNTYFVGDKQGIAAAAKIIFQKDQHDLTLDECALIVGLAKGPTYYNPFQQPTRAEHRTDEVLLDLHRAYAEGAYPSFFLLKYPGFALTDSQISETKRLLTTSKVVKNPTKHSTRPNIIPHGTGDYVDRSQGLMDTYISGPDDVFAIQNLLPGAGYKGIVTRNQDGSLDTLRVGVGGFEITTTIHAEVQTMLSDVLQEHLTSLDKQWPYPDFPLDGAVVCIDNKTGEIRGDVRGRDYKKSEFDMGHALTEEGSVIKAVIFATALEMGIVDSLEQMYVDSAITLHQRQYAGITDTLGRTPRNFGVYSGDTLNLGVAGLVYSRNTAPTFVFSEAAHLGKGGEFLRAIYAKLDKVTAGRYASSAQLRQSPQTGLGLVQSDLNHIAAVYMSFAQGGMVPNQFTDILKIEDAQGGLLYTADKPTRTQLFSEDVCLDLVPYLLQKGRAVSGGKDNILAKSGTTGEGNKLRIVIVTPRFTISLVVGPVIHKAKDPITGQLKVIGRGTRDATSLLSPLVRTYLERMQKLGYYDPNEEFSFQIQEVQSQEHVEDNINTENAQGVELIE